MTTIRAESMRRETLTLRIKSDERGLIDRAAAIAGKTRTDFVLEAARRAAVETLTERTLFTVDATAFAAFQALLVARCSLLVARCSLLRLAPTKL